MGSPATPTLVDTWSVRSLAKFANKFVVSEITGCWDWIGQKNPGGYGRVCRPAKTVLAHRAMWEAVGNRITDPYLTLDHLCRNRACVNPKHLEEVTLTTNSRRGNTASTLNAQKTHCKRGHEFTPENTLSYPSKRCRYCRTCSVLYQRAKRRGITLDDYLRVLKGDDG